MEKYLVKVNAGENNNKFYHMSEGGGGTFTVRYGRVGTDGQTRQYAIDQWDKKYFEKIRKGYKDVTMLREETVRETSTFNCEDKVVKNLMERLMGFSKKFLKKHYSVRGKTVTDEMVSEAQRIIGDMKNLVESGNLPISFFNAKLSELFEVIPRAMVRVDEYVAHDTSEYMEILEREQEILNVMRADVSQTNKVGGELTLDALGLSVRECTDKEMKNILSHIEPSNRTRIVRAFRVENKSTEKAFNEFCNNNDYGDKDIRFYYHGSKNQNWYGILSEGLKLNPDAPITGKAFGRGIYTAPQFDKSRNYASLSDCYWTHENDSVGYVAVFKVAMKNPKHVDSYADISCDATQETMDKYGADGVYAHKGKSLRRDEVIVYREEQVTVRYLLEIA